MIHQALFPQPIITEDEDPIYEINPITTSKINDLSQSEQDRINTYTGNRRAENKKFKLGSKPK